MEKSILLCATTWNEVLSLFHATTQMCIPFYIFEARSLRPKIKWWCCGTPQFTVAIVLQNQCGTILQNHKVFQSVIYNFINYKNMLTSKARQGKNRKKKQPKQ